MTLEEEHRKPYRKPEIIHELELETRAGSGVGDIEVVDPLGIYGHGEE